MVRKAKLSNLRNLSENKLNERYSRLKDEFYRVREYKEAPGAKQRLNKIQSETRKTIKALRSVRSR